MPFLKEMSFSQKNVPMYLCRPQTPMYKGLVMRYMLLKHVPDMYLSPHYAAVRGMTL